MALLITLTFAPNQSPPSVKNIRLTAGWGDFLCIIIQLSEFLGKILFTYFRQEAPTVAVPRSVVRGMSVKNETSP